MPVGPGGSLVLRTRSFRQNNCGVISQWIDYAVMGMSKKVVEEFKKLGSDSINVSQMGCLRLGTYSVLEFTERLNVDGILDCLDVAL